MKGKQQSRQGLRSMGGAALLFGGGAALLLTAAGALADPRPPHPAPAPRQGGVVVQLCDGQTSVEGKDAKPGQPPSSLIRRSPASRLSPRAISSRPRS